MSARRRWFLPETPDLEGLLREQAAMPRRSAAPKARVRPVRTMRTPHSSKVTLPSTFRTVSTPCMIVESYA